ncbi:MAG: alpha/beta hydrolase [Sutterellaceae bacterium]|nr:alpha/beta hydrolase [Burkholderiaceae bacterium]MCX7902210.1 alpha/beta hydrolase [Burkholderiaceae bacterium]MDW8430971.1 alpha/beta hydrolase [Sutterellaceae bacterium]
MLDPQAKSYLELLASLGAPPLHTLPPAQARLAYKKARALAQPQPPAVAAVHALHAPGPGGPIPLRLYRPFGAPASQRLPVLVFLHGGGWTIGDLDTHDVVCRELANRARCAVCSVDYRLAPEHRFPAAVEDTLAATRFIAEQASALGLDATRLAIGGDSAGGNLAAVASLLLRDAGGPLPCLQLLIYPATDLRCNTRSHAANGSGYLLTRELIDYFVGCYLNHPAEARDWRASPALAPSHAGVPPAFILTAGYDPLRDEGADYAERLRQAGVPVEYVCFESQIHGFLTMSKLIDDAARAFDRCAQALQRAFAH